MKKLIILSVVLLALCGTNQAQTKTTNLTKNKSVGLNDIMQSRNYIFKPTSAYTSELLHRSLLSGYEVTISDGKIVLFLPDFSYAGEVVNSYSAGYRVVSTDLNYKAEVNKKGKWTVFINPKFPFNKRLKLIVDKSGYAELYVTEKFSATTQFVGVVESNDEDVVLNTSL